MTRASSWLSIVAVVVAAPLTLPAPAPDAPQQWKCQLDLHQGETGSLELTLAGDALTGSITAGRADDGATPLATTIAGTWTGAVLQFARTLAANEVQPFMGIAARAPDGAIQMAGRFGPAFDGIWSATCPSAGPAPPEDDAGVAGPNLSTRIDPYGPTSRDRIRFIVEARHSTGVEEVTIHVNGQPAQTCTTERCEFVGGPYPAGAMSWRASARARNGGVNEGRDNAVTVAAAPAACSITGAAVGPRAADVRAVFGVALYGPDDHRRFRERKPLGAGTFTFTGLPDGEYMLVADTRADVAVRITPRRHVVSCRGGIVAGIDFDFR